MKFAARLLSLLILVGATLFIAACKGGDENEPSQKEKQIDLLVGTWTAQSVTFDGDSYTDDYTGFTIQITKSSAEAMTYVTQNRPDLSPWNANGTFTFGSDVTSQLVRIDNVDIQYSVSGNTLTLTLEDYSGTGYTAGRTESVEGDWVFVMTK